MNHLEKGLKKASEVIKESGEESPNSDKENTISSAGGSSVRQFYGNKSNRTVFDTCTKSPPLSRCHPDPFHDLSRTSLNIGSSSVKTYRRKKERPFQSNSTSTASSIVHGPSSTSAVPSHKIGFPNAGMTCYLNAVLQTLLGSKFFSSALLKCKNLVESSSNVRGELFNVFISVAKNKEKGNQELVRQSLFQLRQSLGQILPQFADASMQDAHEFLVKFFEVFGDTLKENDVTNKCPFSQTFEYQMSEKKQCLKCNYSTTKSKTEWVLRLDMPPDNSSSPEEFVKRSIQNLVERTLLGTLEMRCGNCNNLCTLHQSTEKFSKLPPILIVYLPRSFFIKEQNSRRKNRTLILTNVVLKLPDQVTPDVDCSKLVLPSSKEALFITPSKKKRSPIDWTQDHPLWSSPETTPEKKSKLSLSDKDINNLSEEEQVKLAMEKSLCESTDIDEEDNRLLAKAIEESMKAGVEEQEESLLLDNEDIRDVIDIKGETVASGDYDYQLTATICHINRSSTSVEMGHYIADVYNGEFKQWFRCNDMQVFPTLLQSVVQQSTYDGTILFYTHRNILEM